jgi:signal transduction histidine kinase
MDLGTGARRVEITFTTPQLNFADNVRFRYRLSGLDEEWHDAGTERRAVFARLPAGHYRFEAMATEADGSWIAPVVLALVLHPHFWETGWFYGCFAVVVVLGVAAAVRLVVKRQTSRELARLERRHVLDQERSRIARDIHDEVGAGLTKIGKLAEGSNDVAITHATRGLAQALDEIVWVVNPRNDTLENVATYLVHYAEQFLRPAGISCRLDVPMSLPDVAVSAAVRHNLYSAVKEALNNAVKHGAPRQVNFGLDLDGDLLTVTVRDDGCGFTPSSPSGGCDGLANMGHRLEALGGRLLLQSQPGQGTSVTMQLRINGGSES